MGKWDNFIQVKEVKGHTCTLDRIDARHQNISADFVASHMYPHILSTPEYALKAIIGAIEEKFGYTIGYDKAYQAKKKVLEYRWGTYEASYHNLPNLLHTIVQMNPGSYYDIKDYPSVEKPGKLVLQRSFLALGACIRAFKFCRPVICIDGTFLTGKYKGTILTDVAAVLTDKRRIHLRSASVRTYTFFTTGFPRFLSIRRARGLQAFDQPLLTNYSNPI
jgi:hypothetical protein